MLSGDESWTLQQAQALRERLGGDGLWVGPEPGSAPCVAPGALKTLLGREVMHAFSMPGAGLMWPPWRP
nr:tRNA(Met) cytidine acetyltransferase TmcA [Klebsiella pneumoniae]